MEYIFLIMAILLSLFFTYKLFDSFWRSDYSNFKKWFILIGASDAFITIIVVDIFKNLTNG